MNDSIELNGTAQASPRLDVATKKLIRDYNVSASIEIAPNVRNSFDHNRFSATQASKFVIDNPKVEHQINLGNY